MPSDIKSAVIKKEAGRYYVSLLIEEPFTLYGGVLGALEV